MWTGIEAGPLAHLSALCRRLPRGCAFSHRTAALILGVDVSLRTSPIDRYEVTAPRNARFNSSADLRVRRARLDHSDIALVGQLPATTALRTTFDLARHLPLYEALAAVDAMLHSGLVEPAALEASVRGRSGWSGVRQARQVVDLAESASESLMESVLRMVLIQGGCPQPAVQHPICDRDGNFIARVDLWYESARLAIEYDGEWHRDNLVRDNRRQNRLLEQGIQLLRFTASDVLQRADLVVAQVLAPL